jgi:hypothetical protein
MFKRESGRTGARDWERAVLFGLVEAPSWRSQAMAALKWWVRALAVALLMVVGAPAAAALANTYFVSSSADSGAGSLRAAIIKANSHPGADTITRAPGVGSLMVRLRSALPKIGQEVLINFLEGDPDRPLVINSSASSTGLVLAPGSGRSTLEGIRVYGAAGNGILVSSNRNLIQGVTVGDTLTRNHNGIYIQSNNNTIGGRSATAADTIVGSTANGVVIQATSGGTAGGNLIEGNFIGTNSAGDGGLGNGAGGVVMLTKAASNNTIGGRSGGTRNVISGNGGEGVLVAGTGTTHNLVEGNLIGLSPSGTTGLPNKNGVVIQAGAGNDTLTRNVISGNSGDGVVVHGTGTSGNFVQGNLIGTNSSGDALGNGGDGVLIDGGARANTIGGTVATQADTIAFNLGGGVLLSGAMTVGNPLLGNVILSSGPNRSGPGIKLVGGADGDEPAPVITSTIPGPAGMTVNGTGVSGSRIEVFANPSCGDPEGGRFLGATTANSSGSWTLAVAPLTVGTGVTATQTSPTAKNTSPFSRCSTAQ